MPSFSWRLAPLRAPLAASLVLALVGCAGKPKADDAPAPMDPSYTTVLYARVMAGKGSGVVGVPLENVEVTLHLSDETAGPVYTDPSGTLEVDAAPLFPEGVSLDAASLSKVEPINVELHFDKAGYLPSVEIVTFPVDKYKDFTFYLKGEGD